MKDSRGYHGCKRPRSALPPAPGRLHACRRTGRVPPPGPGERKSPAFRRRGSGSAGAQGPESDRAAPSRRRRPHRRGTRRERRLLPRRAGARTRGLFKSRGRAGPDRARRQGAAAACAGLGLLRHRGALSPAQLRPRPPAVRTSPLRSARLGSVQPSTTRLGSARFSPARLGSAPLGSAQHGSARRAWARGSALELGSDGGDGGQAVPRGVRQERAGVVQEVRREHRQGLAAPGPHGAGTARPRARLRSRGPRCRRPAGGERRARGSASQRRGAPASGPGGGWERCLDPARGARWRGGERRRAERSGATRGPASSAFCLRDAAPRSPAALPGSGR